MEKSELSRVVERSGEWRGVESSRVLERSGEEWIRFEGSGEECHTAQPCKHTIIILTLALTVIKTQNHTPILIHAPHRLIREQAKGRRRGGATTRIGEEVGSASKGRDQGRS